MMEEKKWSREIAAASIMNKRPEVKNIPAWLFQQIDAPKIELRSNPIIENFIHPPNPANP
jgi:hypothetical protein